MVTVVLGGGTYHIVLSLWDTRQNCKIRGSQVLHPVTPYIELPPEFGFSLVVDAPHFTYHLGRVFSCECMTGDEVEMNLHEGS